MLSFGCKLYTKGSQICMKNPRCLSGMSRWCWPGVLQHFKYIHIWNVSLTVSVFPLKKQMMQFSCRLGRCKRLFQNASFKACAESPLKHGLEATLQHSPPMLTKEKHKDYSKQDLRDIRMNLQQWDVYLLGCKRESCKRSQDLHTGARWDKKHSDTLQKIKCTLLTPSKMFAGEFVRNRIESLNYHYIKNYIKDFYFTLWASL